MLKIHIFLKIGTFYFTAKVSKKGVFFNRMKTDMSSFTVPSAGQVTACKVRERIGSSPAV